MSFELPENPEQKENIFTSFAESKASEKHPDHNEDAYFLDPDHGAFGMFDGMGGHAGGEIAARIAQDIAARELPALDERLPEKEMEKALATILFEIDTAIQKEVANDPSSKLKGMGCTGDLIKILTTQDNAEMRGFIAHVGDSRVYGLTPTGELLPITLDDNLFLRSKTLQKGYAAGIEIQKRLSNATNITDLSEEDQLLYKKRATISQALGHSSEDTPLTPRIYPFSLPQGSRIIATTDGIHDNLTDTEIEEIVKSPHTRSIPKQLVWAASKRAKEKSFRSKMDDMTALVVAPEIPEE